MNEKKLISIVTPVFNESETIARYFERMHAVLNELKDKYDFEYVITDNCSEDNTFELIKEYAKNDPRIRAFRFSRNFGYQKSILTGYCQARGDAAIEFDADLQDPPELLSSFLDAWSQGNKIVYGIRKNRKESLIIKTIRKIFYRLLNVVSEVPLPVDAGDFILIDRIIIDKLRDIKDHNLYLRGIIFSMGFKRLGIPYLRSARYAGKSKFPFFKMLSLAIDGIISHSITPLRLSTYFGIIVVISTTILLAVYLFLYFCDVVLMPRGFTTTTLLILFALSFNALFLGILGEYVGRILLQIQYRPMTVIAEMTEHKGVEQNMSTTETLCIREKK